MVQRTVPCRPTDQPARRHQPPSHGQHQGGGDAKARKKVVPIEITDLELQHVQVCHQTVQKRSPPPPPPADNKRPDAVPNYMRPTRSSDARKEDPSNAKLKNTSVAGTLQPGKARNHLVATAADKKSDRRSSNTSPAASVLKAARVLKRKPTFKAIKLAAKKAAGVSLPPKQSVNRATCSSTLKDSRFPVALDLNPGGTDAEGTSAVKVCPYSYCSLNGHVHEPLPPLKGFLSSRRKLLRAQRSMKLKGLSPFRKQGSGKGAGCTDTGQAAVARTRSGREIACLIEELATDFFVEIYTRPEEQVTESASTQGTTEESPEVVDKFEETRDGMEFFSSQEDHESCIVDKIQETCSDHESFEGDLDSSDISIEELEMMMKFLEYVSCDHQAEADKVNESNTAPEKYEDLDHECSVEHGLERGIKDAETGTKVEEAGNDLEEDADQFPDDKSVSSAYSWGSLCPTLGDLFGNENLDVKSSLEPGSTLAPEGTEAAGELYCKEHEDAETDLSADAFEGADAEVKFNELAGPELLEGKNNGDGLITSEPHYSDKKCSDLGLCQEAYLKAGGSLAELPMPESSSMEKEDTTEIDDQSKNDVDCLCLQSGNMRLGNKKNLKDEEFEDDQNNRRFNIMRRPVTEELDDTTEFNPRAPNFLPEVPDPEAEKVDLKHQMMDERKNAEDWMIDHALQQAVTKLGTRRRQKVQLLVEAFETVLPLPLPEKAPGHAAPSFADPRPIQTCN